MLRTIGKALWRKARLEVFKIRERRSPKFVCPVCAYRGPFKTIDVQTGARKFGMCPKCGARERHRIQIVVLRRLFSEHDFSNGRMLHFAPEVFMRPFFASKFARYETADIDARDVDHQVDLRSLPFEDASFDFVFASHVLEHIDDDVAALREIRRILKPGGIAVLPVPIVAHWTIEYPEPNPFESMHVRAPGLDYYDRYKAFFSRISLHHSDEMPAEYQCFAYEDRTKLPTENSPLRPPMLGERHPDIVPVCYV